MLDEADAGPAPVVLDCRNGYESDVGGFDAAAARPLETEAVKETWASGIDAKWGVTPVWRKVTACETGLVFARECETFRVMGWPIRLRQTFHVRKKGFGFVVLKAVTERL